MVFKNQLLFSNFIIFEVLSVHVGFPTNWGPNTGFGGMNQGIGGSGGRGKAASFCYSLPLVSNLTLKIFQ